MGRPPATSALEDLEHPLLTTGGLLVESHAGLSLRAERRLGAETGLTAQWFEVLLRLVRSPGRRLRMSDLAAQTTLSASGLTRVVDRLEDAGLVRREACPSDRRGAFAALTEEGETRILQAVPLHVAHLVEIFQPVFTPAELETFASLLRRLRDALNPDAARVSQPD